MLLSKLVNCIAHSGFFEDCEVSGIVTDSRQIKEGNLFICLKGARFDGHSVAAQVLENGAVAVVTDHDIGLKQQVIVENTRYAYARLCSEYFGRPQDKLKMIAVTGTNGKTTTANVIKQALEKLGHKTGVIGTIESQIGDIALAAKFTTPEPWELMMILSRMAAVHCEYAVMEASSQALEQGRLLDMHYDCAIFTNLSQDHLDYHKTMEAYFEAKKILFGICDKAVVNSDDPKGKELISELEVPYRCFSQVDKEADLFAYDVAYKIDGVDFKLNSHGETAECSFPMPGKFSVYNAMGCISALQSLGFTLDEACDAVSSTSGVAGRCEVLHKGDLTVIGDYAHTDDALRKLLSSLKPYVKGRLIVLFGCAGKRDKTKRPKMARAVCEFADYVVLSSDNPRDENPFDIDKSLSLVVDEYKLPYAVIPDRFYAVHAILREMKKGDVFVLTNKGHEDYQVINGCSVYLDERRIVRDYFSKRGMQK